MPPLRRAVLALLIAVPSAAQSRRPVAPSDVDAIARLVMMEDHRIYDSTELAGFLAASHPEVRRRAAVAIARVNDPRGAQLLRVRPVERDTALAATVVFAVGQLRDTNSVAYLDSVLNDARSAPTVAMEAAIGLGKVRSMAAREALVRFLARGTVGLRDTPAIREALLSVGRTQVAGENAAVIRWTASPREELRWRATWSLVRARDPRAMSTVLAMSRDRSPMVRAWAVRGLARGPADSAGMTDSARARLIAAVRDADRSVRTEAVRALGTHDGEAVVATLESALRSPDTWIAVSAAEGLGRLRSSAPALLEATGRNRPCAVRVVAMQQLAPFAADEAAAAAFDIMSDTVPFCRVTAARAITAPNARAGGRSVDSALGIFRSARRDELGSTPDHIRIGAIRALAAFGDTTDVNVLTRLRQSSDSLSAMGIATTAAINDIRRRATSPAAGADGRGGGRGAGDGRGGAGGRGRGGPPRGSRSLPEYREIVERWVVPAWKGAARPVARWQTPKGTFDIELYPDDAPIAVDDFVRTMNAGTMIGTEFTRVVPNFVNQQQTIRAGNTLRDEVNRKGLTRGNVAWATAGLDTGSPGYTLGHTAQPHNEGSFTSLGRVVRGMDVVDRTDLGDRIVSARMLQPAASRR